MHGDTTKQLHTEQNITNKNMNRKNYLNEFDIVKNGCIHEQDWANANIAKFHKSIEYFITQCTLLLRIFYYSYYSVCQEAWPLKSKPRSPYVCSRCSRDKAK